MAKKNGTSKIPNTAQGKKTLNISSAHAARDRETIFFISIFFNDLSKIYVAIFFFQKCHPTAGWFGGKELPPD